MRRQDGRGPAITLAILAIVLATAGNARAGTYTVSSCALPDGSPAPTDGWAAEGYPREEAMLSNTCSPTYSDRALTAWLGISPPSATYSRWKFTAPAGTTIDSYVLYRHEAASGVNGNARDVWHRLDVNGGMAVDGCLVWPQGCSERGSTDPDLRMSSANAVEHEAYGAHALSVEAWCDALAPAVPSCAPVPGGVVSIYAARMRLTDPTAPTLDGMSGSLVATEPLDGVAMLSLGASDAGGGLARATLLVDDVPMRSVKPEAATSTCAEPYVIRVPCPLRSDFTIALDTRAVSNGRHRTQVRVEDVGGNTTYSDPWPVTVANPGVPNGAGATRFAALSGAFKGAPAGEPLRRHVGFGGRARLTGRLVDRGGGPIAGAALQVAFRLLRPGAAWHPWSPVRTDARGNWTVLVPRGSSREVRVGYRAFSLDEAPSRELITRVDVSAEVRLTITPRHVGRRGTIRFRGRLPGGPGQDGVHVALYAVDARGRGRVPVAMLRCDRRGVFGYRYRFSRTPQPTAYEFQAVLERQQGYPYAPGRSPRVTVGVG